MKKERKTERKKTEEFKEDVEKKREEGVWGYIDSDGEIRFWHCGMIR
jgi:hypothetical protein